MIELEIKEKADCMGCYGCYNICPKNCINMKRDEEGFYYPKVDDDQCIECGECIKVCPIINKKTIDNNPKAYACINTKEPIRLESSSGGIFTLLAEQTIYRDGVVFGAAFDKSFNLHHSYTETISGLEKYRGSKYIQSKISKTYSQAKDFLDAGRHVLFSGTPCQIGGLKSYLGKDYDKLICVDIICHGVPSPMVWEKYITYREKESGSISERIVFRLKNEGWKQYSVLFSFKNNTEYKKTHRKDLYMRAFLKDVCLRPSCYDCSFKSIHRDSDITLADFWGIQDILPELDDDKGTSLIFVNTTSGKEILKNIKENMIYKAVDINHAVKYNSAAIKSVDRNPNRENFFDELEVLNFDELVKKYCTDKLTIRILRKIKSIISFR